jgi:hypothetical protein
MSYILNVLKKLESENKNSEQNVDLKKAILNDDIVSAPQKKSHQISPLIIGLSASLLTIVILVALSALYFIYSTDKKDKTSASPTPALEKTTKKGHTLQEVAQSEDVIKQAVKKPSKPLVTAAAVSPEIKGITLAALQKEEEKKKRVSVAYTKESVSEVKTPSNTFTPLPRAPEKKNREKIPPVREESVRPVIIKEKHSEKNPVQLSQREKRSKNDQTSTSDDSDELPDFKIKGAMYIGEGDDANYVIIEYDDTTYRLNEGESARLKQGESVAEVELLLLKIQPNKALFRYKKRDFMRKF